MAPLFSKVDSNKLWLDVKETVIGAKFGKDLFNISKVVGRKTKWPRFFGLSRIRCYQGLLQFGTKLNLTVSEIFNIECNAMVDMTLLRPLNKGQGHLFWYQ